MVIAKPISPHQLDMHPQRQMTGEGESSCISASPAPKKNSVSIVITPDNSPGTPKTKAEANQSQPLYLVEVTIQSLENIFSQQVESPTANATQTSDLTAREHGIFGASVAFGGSSKRNNMQVGSNSVCNQTGRLLVESNPVPNHQSCDSVTWGVVDKPHMSMSILERKIQFSSDQGTGRACPHNDLSFDDNGDKNVDPAVSVAGSKGDSATSSTDWSLLADSNSQPDDAVEVLVRLKQSPQVSQSEAAVASCWDGVAYIVIPTAPGRHQIAANVQIPKTSTKPRSGDSQLTTPLDGAILNATVTISPSAEEMPRSDSMTATLTHMTPSTAFHSRPTLPAEGVGETKEEEPLEDRIKASQDQALLDFEAQKGEMKGTASHRPDDWTLAYLLDKIFAACVTDNSCIGATNPNDDLDDINGTDNSTIATRPSWGI